MGTADWSIAVGILVFIVAIVFAAYYYLKYKRIYLIVFVASVSTYIFSVFYTWDVFDLTKNLILAILIVSCVIMLFLGKYFSKLDLKPTKSHSLNKDK